MVRTKPQRTHTLPPTTPLAQQVGGHAGVQVTEDDSLLLKPALPSEIAFYQFVRDIADSDPSSGVHALKPWIPKFFGLLSLEGKLATPDIDVGAGTAPAIIPVPVLETTSAPDGTNNALDAAESNPPTQSLVLENLLYGYSKPCILDVKLGTKLYDEDAPEEKKARMIKKAKETTTFQTGLRLTGFQVYSNRSPDPVVYGRTYGYSLKPEQLQEGIRNFFPHLASADADTGTCPPTNSSIGHPLETLLTLLTSIHTSLTDLRTSLSAAHVRMVGSSVLVIYEGDQERAALARGRGGGPNVFDELEVEEDDEVDSDWIEVQVDDTEEGALERTLNDTSESASSMSHTDPQPRLYTIALIDFAHTRVVPGEGPDQGVLKGLDTLIRLVAQRKEEVAASMHAERSDRLSL